MATYLELAQLPSDAGWSGFVDRVSTAVAIKAETIAGGTPTAEQKAWAVAALADPRSTANDLIFFLLAANSTATTAQILGATDASIQTNVDTAVDTLFV